MKYFITTLIALITVGNSFAKCDNDTILKVNDCIVNDKITEYIDYETCSWPEDTKLKDMLFVNLICDPVVPFSFFETKLQEWKDVNIARITEELRIEDIANRLKAIGIKFGKHKSITGLREFMIKCNYQHSNPAIWIKQVFLIGNEAMLTCLESKKVEVDQDKIDVDTKKSDDEEIRTLMNDYDCQLSTDQYAQWMCMLNKK